MAKRTTRFQLTLPPRLPGAPAGRWLYDSLRQAILAGRLPPGAHLPSTRDVAQEYGLARGTVVQAFDDLRWEGYLQMRVGSGARVNPTLPDPGVGRSDRSPQPPSQPRARRLSDYGS